MSITGNFKISIAVIASLFAGAVHVARAQGPIVPPLSSGTNEVPFIDITIRGTQFVSAPGALYYRVTADPGTYVIVFRVSPSGRVTILRGYDQAIGGTKRTTIFRETSTDYDDGLGYLVAVANRDKTEARNLVHQSIARFGLAGRLFSADGALNDLLENVIAKSGKHFAAAFVSYRSSTYRYSSSFADYAYCPGAFTRGPLAANFAYYDIFDELRDVHGNSLHSSFLKTCYGELVPPILVLGPVKPLPPQLPGDTTSGNGEFKLLPPRGPKPEPPVGTLMLGREAGGTAAEFFTLRTLPVIPVEPRTTPVEPGIPVSEIHSATPLPMMPLTSPMVETERREPVTPVPAPLPVSPPPPPPPPRTETKTLDPGTIPPP